MKVGNYIPYIINSTGTLKLVQTPLTLANVKILISHSQIDQTITFYDASGSIIGDPLTLSSSTEIKLKFVDMSAISFSDPNTYSIIALVQIIKFDREENFLEYSAEADISMVPINSVEIIGPLDPNGNVNVDVQTPLPFRNSINVNGFHNTLASNTSPQALTGVGTIYNFIILYNDNSDTIYIGDNLIQPIPIASKTTLTLYINEAPINGNSIYWISGTTGDVIYGVYA